MKKQRIVLAGLALLMLLASWQSAPQKEHYDKLWKKVNQYTAKDMPRSALKTVQLIYQQAKTDGKTDEVIKSLLYRIRLQSMFQENYRLQSIRLFQQELKTAGPVEKQLLSSLLAQLYQNYFDENRYKILDQQTKALPSDTAFQTWDAQQWNQNIAALYLASVQNREKLTRIPLKKFSVLLKDTDSLSYTFWPTLYDLLAYRAIHYFSSGDADYLFPEKATPADTLWLAPVSSFLNIRFASEAPSNQTKILTLFQHLLALHQTRQDTAALVDVDLRRLHYVMQQLPADRQTLQAYRHSLEKLQQKYSSHPVSVRIASELAQVYVELDNNTRSTKINYLKKADSLCRTVLKQFPKALFAPQCQNQITALHQADFSFQMQQALLPNKPFLIKITEKNISRLYWKMVRIPFENQKDLFSPASRKELKKYVALNPVKAGTQALPFPNDLHSHSAQTALPALPAGSYVLFLTNDSAFSKKSTIIYQHFQVTRMALLSHADKTARTFGIFVLDRNTGFPIPGTQVKAFARYFDYQQRKQQIVSLGKFTADENGFLEVPVKKNSHFNGYIFQAVKGKDTTVINTFASFYGNLYEQKPFEKTYIFTDRAVYRPGQTVYFKAILTRQKGNDIHVVAGKKITIRLMSPQFKKLDHLTLVTDSSGSVSGSFILPDEALNGRFLLMTSNGSKGFLMENYKRPTFYIAFDTLKKAFALNQEITLKGKVGYYFGGKADSLPVKYTVTREIYYPLWDFGIPRESIKTPIQSGKIYTDANGHFLVTFRALADPSVPANRFPVYRFVLRTEVTDASGETHVATRDIRLSKRAVLLSVNIPQSIIRENMNGIEMDARNLSGNPVPAKLHVRLYRLTPPHRYILPPLWSPADTTLLTKDQFLKLFPHSTFGQENNKSKWPKTLITAMDIQINGKTLVLPGVISHLKPGEYKVTAQVTGEPSTPVTKFFTVFSLRSKKLPDKAVFMHLFSAETAHPGDIVECITGTASGKMHLLYEVLNGKQVVQRQWLSLGKKPVKINIPVEKAYRGNFFIRLTAIRHNYFFSQTQTIHVPFTDKKLQLSIETSRNYLKPGGKEQWTLKVDQLSGLPQPAFVLAGMYDASLDVYASNSWKFFPYFQKNPGTGWRSYRFYTSRSRILSVKNTKYLPEIRITRPRINWFGYPISGFYTRRGPLFYATAPVALSKAAPVTEQALTEKEAPPAKNTRSDTQNLPQEHSEKQPVLRTNFRETAFFYPDLRTDKNGNVTFHFTLPDVLTRWKFMALAYTKDMKIGTITREFEARKPLSVLPHLPRFIRQGDQLLFTARVSNLSDKNRSVSVNISFFDASTGKKINLFLTRQTTERHLTLQAGKNGTVSWMIRIPENLHFLEYHIQAVSGKDADGEQRMIPVLSNRQLITESLPLFVPGNQQKQFTFTHLVQDTSASLQNFRYTLTFTSHPAWYAIQALPALEDQKTESVENIFYRFYAQTLAAKLLQTYPRIRQVFQQWKQKSPEAFLSELEKDQSLKNVVLQASPWLLEAQNETEQKRRIALFFDLNQMQHKQQSALNRLQAAQLPSGGWSWFPGMPADCSVTENILSGLADLIRMKAIDIDQHPEITMLMNKGIGYLDREMQKEYEQIKKQNPKTLHKNHLTDSRIRYCYLRTEWLTEKPVGNKNQSAFHYFCGQIKQYWPQLNNNQQALAAMVLNRLGWRYEAEAVIRALNEKSLLNAQHGMYWRNDSPYTNNSISTEVNILKAFMEVMHDNRAVEKMKTWLVLQKQATCWPGTKATADAVYALLMNGTPLLSETQPVKVTMGNGEQLPEAGQNKQAGTGYFTRIWNGKEITPSLAKITVQNPNRGMVYGAASWQYFENLNKIEKHSGQVSIEKTLFKEVKTADGRTWKALSPEESLQLGDRIMVRLLIHSNRSVDFVDVQDMRAAALEPETLLSSYKSQGGLYYYEDIKDATTHFYIRHLPKGTFVLEYPLLVTQKGTFSDGVARIQSLYLPSFAAHSSGHKIIVR